MQYIEIKAIKDIKTEWALEGNEEGKWKQIGAPFARRIDAQSRYKDYSENLRGQHEFRLIRITTTIERAVEEN